MPLVYLFRSQILSFSSVSSLDCIFSTSATFGYHTESWETSVNKYIDLLLSWKRHIFMFLSVTEMKSNIAQHAPLSWTGSLKMPVLMFEAFSVLYQTLALHQLINLWCEKALWYTYKFYFVLILSTLCGPKKISSVLMTFLSWKIR